MHLIETRWRIKPLILRRCSHALQYRVGFEVDASSSPSNSLEFENEVLLSQDSSSEAKTGSRFDLPQLRLGWQSLDLRGFEASQ